MSRLSVIVPCRNHEAVVGRTHARLVRVFRASAVDAELIFVDDGSGDRTVSRLREIARADPSVRVICLSRSFGAAAAASAGLRHCAGEAAVVLDADLPDPPEEVPRMLEVMEREGCSVVYGRRIGPDGERAPGLAARARRRILDFLSDVKLPPGDEGFRVIDRRVIDVLNGLPERNKYLRGLIGWIGFKQAAYHYVGPADGTRAAGAKSAAARALFAFSRRPLKLAVGAGLASVGVAVGLAVWVVVRKLAFSGETIPGWASTVLVVLFIGGVQLLSTGILGVYIGNIFDESKGRPEYVVAELINVDVRSRPPQPVLTGEGA